MLGVLYPEYCLASHINFLCVKPSIPRTLWLSFQHALQWWFNRENAGINRTKWYISESSGYMVLQSTKPSTLGFGITDSPVALLSWIYEKLHDWTDNYAWTDDEILTWISIYQFSTAGPAASVRIYYEAAHASRNMLLKSLEYVPRVPLGISYYPKDLMVLPKTSMLGMVVGPNCFRGGA